ncbi:glutaredoxin family protein [Candidatus Woesearchaeota archaeon]|nr:glutaredoxin family protein [Candidatus Woesearchaeota archaeon]
MEIKVYITPTCVWCKKLKEWLTKKKIPYQLIDIIESDKDRDAMIEKSGQMATPVIDADGEIIVGFDEAKLEKIAEKIKGKK